MEITMLKNLFEQYLKKNLKFYKNKKVVCIY